VDDVVVAWFDRFLKDAGAAAHEAPVTVYVLFDGWRDFDAWPPAAARPTDWYLHSGGRANTASGDGTLSADAPGDEPADVFVYNPAAPPPGAGGHSCCLAALAPMGPACQAEREAQKAVLVYTTDLLERPLELVGDVVVTLFAASTAIDTDFTARLCVVDEEGRSTNLLEGIVRARYRDSLSTPSLLEPGRVYELRIALGPIAALVEAGRRLRLQVSSSDFPQWDRNLNTGGRLGAEGPAAAVTATQFVLHDRDQPSRISLPVLG
jgi:putative CocE/NonD family hydrolase